MQKITSKENEFIKHVKKLKDKKYRDKSNEYVIEGIKLIKEALQEKAQINQIVICEDCEKSGILSDDLKYEIAKQECIYVPQNIFKTISEVSTPQGILAIVEKNNIKNKDSEIDYNQDIIVALDDIQDPGNLGTILRTVDSIGLKQILVSKGTADSYNPKVVRSTMGAIFRVKIIECEKLSETLKQVKAHKYQVLATSLKTKNSIYDIDYNKKVIVIGNEANGINDELISKSDKLVKIPIYGNAESLNAAISAAILMYEIKKYLV